MLELGLVAKKVEVSHDSKTHFYLTCTQRKKKIQPQMFDFSFIYQKNQNKQQKIGHNLYQGG